VKADKGRRRSKEPTHGKAENDKGQEEAEREEKAVRK